MITLPELIMYCHLLKVTKFLVKISQCKFLVMIEKNIFLYKIFLSLNILDFRNRMEWKVGLKGVSYSWPHGLFKCCDILLFAPCSFERFIYTPSQIVCYKWNNRGVKRCISNFSFRFSASKASFFSWFGSALSIFIFSSISLLEENLIMFSTKTIATIFRLWRL